MGGWGVDTHQKKASGDIWPPTGGVTYPLPGRNAAPDAGDVPRVLRLSAGAGQRRLRTGQRLWQEAVNAEARTSRLQAVQPERGREDFGGQREIRRENNPEL